jgi:Txe/YoeB family toxin of Txe-Axe toxin-antitoxin module
MNPELPAPQASPERTPINYGQSGEFGPQINNPERSVEFGREQEQGIGRVEQAPVMPAPPPVLPMPSAVQPVVVPMPVVQKQDDNPTIAADDDLIEKEWVDKAKKIIAETRDDPYKREQEVSRLQADYLRKRYGREIGIST